MLPITPLRGRREGCVHGARRSRRGRRLPVPGAAPAPCDSEDTAFTFIVSDVIYPAGDVADYRESSLAYRGLPGPVFAIPGTTTGTTASRVHDGALRCRPRPAAAVHRPARTAAKRAFLDLVWREPSEAPQEELEEMQAAPARAVRPAAAVLRDRAEGAHARGPRHRDPVGYRRRAGRVAPEISKRPKDKILLTGKPLVVDAARKPCPIAGWQRHREHDRRGSGQPLHRRHRRGHPQLPALPGAPGGRPGHAAHRERAAGAYTKATHKIPTATRRELRLRRGRLPLLPAPGRLARRLLDAARPQLPLDFAIRTDAGARGDEPPPRRRGRPDTVGGPGEARSDDASPRRGVVFPSPNRRSSARSARTSPSSSTGTTPPPLFKSFLKVETRPGEIEIRCFAATGCEEHADDPPLEDRIKGTRGGDGPGRGRYSLTENGSRAWPAIFQPLAFPPPRGEEPALPLEHLRPLRQLRRLGHADADRLGRQVRARRHRRGHLLEHPGAPARADRAQLRAPRLRRQGAVLARARQARARRAARSTSSSSPSPAGSATSRASSTTRASPPRTSPTRCTASRASG